MHATVMHATGCVPPPDLHRRISVSSARQNISFANLPITVPASYDARATGLIGPIKNQGPCGDCWNFAGIGAAEIAVTVFGGSPGGTGVWSEQSVLDCGSNHGCSGDWFETVFEQAMNSGIANVEDYPYTGVRSTCKNVPHPNFVFDYGYVGTSDVVPSTTDIKKAILTYGSVAVAVYADATFQGYTGGIFSDSGAGAIPINHAVVLIGWNDDGTMTAGGYWILRNQWGTTWGEGGYMRIAYGANQIGYGAMWVSTFDRDRPRIRRFA